MTRSRSITFLATAAVIPLTALALASCGGGSTSDATASTAPPTTANGRPATVGVSNIGGLGRILVDSQGRTVYLFEKDTGPRSTCSGACATEWPPVTTDGEPDAGKGVTASMVGTTKRSDGATQVTYNGHPLYLFQGDNKPGDAAGQNVDAFGAEWYVLSPAGNKLEGKAGSSGGGYAY
jgi:predicted lipoprotein with Yx(FWY)xxD motif